MPAFLVHGVPDTHRMWDPLRTALARDDVLAPDVPFAPGATKEALTTWLAAQLEAVGRPVDLVGHDWGAMLCLRAASTRPDLVRTLATGSGPVDEKYTWHDNAKLLQTPEVGEQVMAALTPDALAPALESWGLPPDVAAAGAAALDDDRRTGILDLYRSAIHVGAEWGPDLDRIADARTPSLVLWGADDPFCGPDVGERIAARTRARLVVYDAVGHWWPVQNATDVATELHRLWA